MSFCDDRTCPFNPPNKYVEQGQLEDDFCTDDTCQNQRYGMCPDTCPEGMPDEKPLIGGTTAGLGGLPDAMVCPVHPMPMPKLCPAFQEAPPQCPAVQCFPPPPPCPMDTWRFPPPPSCPIPAAPADMNAGGSDKCPKTCPLFEPPKPPQITKPNPACCSMPKTCPCIQRIAVTQTDKDGASKDDKPKKDPKKADKKGGKKGGKKKGKK